MSLELALAARQFASLLSEIAFEANVPRESPDERDGHLKKLREDVRAQTRHLVGLLVVRDRLANTDPATWPGGFMAGMPAGSSSHVVRRDVEAACDRAVNLVHAVMHGSARGDRPDQLVTASESLTALARLVLEIEHDAVHDGELAAVPPTARRDDGPAEPGAEAGGSEQVANAPTTPTPKVHRRGKNVTARRLEALQNQGDSVAGRSAQEWADALGCGKSTVVETQTWESGLGVRRVAQGPKNGPKKPRRQ